MIVEYLKLSTTHCSAVTRIASPARARMAMLFFFGEVDFQRSC